MKEERGRLTDQETGFSETIYCLNNMEMDPQRNGEKERKVRVGRQTL